MNVTNCTFCGQQVSPSGKLIPSLDEKDKSYTYLFFPCCQYYKQDPFLTHEVISKLYEKEYGHFHKKALFKILSDRVTKQRARRFNKLIRNHDILEIGSSTGEFLNACRTFGAKSLKGVEISEFASNIAREKFKLDITHSTFEDFNSDKKYDVIFMFHVIEHVKDPVAVIAKCSSLLNKGGTLIMETPNWDSFESQFYGAQWVGWQAPFHTYLYSPATMRILITKAGIHLDRIHFNSFSNSYSFAIPYLIKHRRILQLPFLTIQFLLKTIRNTVIMTIEAAAP
ncbi:MAG: class I SAM-dependent methyltransferase [Saprospiraceae bacterium]